MGVLLDSFHWHCAGEHVADIEDLTNEQVVVVHVNDAIANRSIDDQVAFERELPGDSGVIDLNGFIAGLRHIGYDGPITAEPMNQSLSAQPTEQKLDRTAAAVRGLVNG